MPIMTTPSPPLSSAHLQNILESIDNINDHEPTLHKLLFHKIKENYSIGPLVDDEFFNDLARALISCRKRANEREKRLDDLSVDSDSDPESVIRGSERKKMGDNSEAKTSASSPGNGARSTFMHRRSSPDPDSDDDMDFKQHDSDAEEMEMQQREDLTEDLEHMTLRERWKAATTPSPRNPENVMPGGSSSSKKSFPYRLLQEFELMGKVKSVAKAFETGNTPSPSKKDEEKKTAEKETPRTPSPPPSVLLDDSDDDLDGYGTPCTHMSAENINNVSINFDAYMSGKYNQSVEDDPEMFSPITAPKQKSKSKVPRQPPPPTHSPEFEKQHPPNFGASGINNSMHFRASHGAKPLSAEKLKPFSFRSDSSTSSSQKPLKVTPKQPSLGKIRKQTSSSKSNGARTSSPFRNTSKQPIYAENSRSSSFGKVGTARVDQRNSIKQTLFTEEPKPSTFQQKVGGNDPAQNERKARPSSNPSYNDAAKVFHANSTKHDEPKPSRFRTSGTGNIFNGSQAKSPTSGETDKINPSALFENKTAFKTATTEQTTNMDGVSSVTNDVTSSKSVDSQTKKSQPSPMMNGPPKVSRSPVRRNFFGAPSFSGVPAESPAQNTTNKQQSATAPPMQKSNAFGMSPGSAPAAETQPFAKNTHIPAAVPPMATVNNPILNNSTAQAMPSFQVDLSKSKSTKRASPRTKFRNKKKLNIETKNNNLSDIPDPTESTKTPANGPHVKNFSKSSDSPEEMDIDTPKADEPNVDNANDAASQNTAGSVPLVFNIGTGSKPPATPGRGFASWKADRLKKANGTGTNRVKPTSVPSPRNTFAFSSGKLDEEVEKKKKEKEDKISRLREEAKAHYGAKKYRLCVLKYTEAISVSTDSFTKMPDPVKKTAQSESLATLYGNRAAGLMMIGAFSPAAVDCDRALKFLNDYNPLSLDLDNEAQVLSFLKVDGGLTLMTKLHARKGRAYVRCGRVNEAEQTFKETERIAQSGIRNHEKIKAQAASRGLKIPMESQQQASEKVLNNCLNEVILFRKELERLRSNSGSIQSMGGVRRSVDIPLARQNNPHILPFVNASLKLSPSDERMQESKVLCLASMRRWTELNMFCESLACSNVELDGIFVGDLKETNNRLSHISPAKHINQPGLKPAVESGSILMSAKQAAEAVVRLPSVVAKLYIRGLRLEERYDEAEHAIKALVSLAERLRSSLLSPSQKTEKAKLIWCASEVEKIHKTIREKDMGDRCYRDGDYAQAAEWYASVLKIDGEETESSYKNPWEMETAGGRLHAVLHCNRAACLMASKRFDHAAKECTAALKTQPGYMKAMLRRARCYARLHRFVESIAEYDRWVNLVREAKANPRYRSVNDCQFDRAANISDADFQKAMGERAEAVTCKQTMEEKAKREKEEAKRRASSAYNREQFYNQHRASGSRPWDSFNGTGPKTGKNHRGYNHNRSSSYSSYTSTGSNHSRSKSSNNFRSNDYSKTKPSPSSDSVKCHYKVLNVKRDATSGEIKKAYHKMALKYHPDKNKSDSAADIFRKVKVAYETLSDENQRSKYDVERQRQFSSHYY